MNSFNSALLTAKRGLFLAKHVVLNTYVVEGECRGVPLTMLVADDGSTLPYIRHLAFPHGSDTSKKGMTSALDAPELIKSGADIIVVGANQLLLDRYVDRGFHLVPKWICPLFHMSDDPDTTIGNLSYDARKDIRRNIRQALDRGFKYETTTDPSWFDRFYNDVYMQYGTSKHGELAQMDGYRRVNSAFTRGVGLTITLDESPVIAAVVFKEDSTMRARYMGVYPGKEKEASLGAPTAMYYYSMQLAHSWGCSAVNLGSSRPFLSDGVLKFKMKWEPEILHDELSTAVFAIAAPTMTPAAQTFMAANPFFEMVDDRLQLHKLSSVDR